MFPVKSFDSNSRKYVLLRRLLCIQVVSVLIGFLCIFLTYRYVSESLYASAESKLRVSIESKINLNQDKWRAWYQVGLHEVLGDELAAFKNEVGLSDLFLVPVAELNDLKSKPDFIAPKNFTDSDVPVATVVVAHMDPQLILGAKINNKSFFVILTLCFLLFLCVLVYSAMYIYKKIHLPIRELSDAFESHARTGQFNSQSIMATGEMRDFVNAINSMYLKAIENEKAVSFQLISTQVAHDIRSPLAALSVLASTVLSGEGEYRDLVNESIKRIQGIVSHLNQKAGINRFNVKLLDIPSVLEGIISEKRVLYGIENNVQIVIELVGSRDSLIAFADETELKRIFSNVINNAIESLKGRGNGRVELSIESLVDFILVRIRDNGCGIPSGVLSQLGTVGVTYDKENGSGLGLYHAISTLKQWGGLLDVQSKVAVGTVVEMRLRKTVLATS